MDRYLRYIILAAVIIAALYLVSCNQKSASSGSAIIIDNMGQAISGNGKELYLIKDPGTEYKIGDVVEITEKADDNSIVAGEVSKNVTRNLVDNNLVLEIINNNPEIILIDVRTIAEYNSGHIEGAINYPVENISSKSSLAWDKDKTLIVYCRSGSRSATAAKRLNDLGYELVLDGGGVNSYAGKLVK